MFKAFVPVVVQMYRLNHPPLLWQVCDYYKTTVLKDADSVKDIGKMASVFRGL